MFGSAIPDAVLNAVLDAILDAVLNDILDAVLDCMEGLVYKGDLLSEEATVMSMWAAAAKHHLHTERTPTAQGNSFTGGASAWPDTKLAISRTKACFNWLPCELRLKRSRRARTEATIAAARAGFAACSSYPM